MKDTADPGYSDSLNSYHFGGFLIFDEDVDATDANAIQATETKATEAKPTRPKPTRPKPTVFHDVLRDILSNDPRNVPLDVL